MLFGMLEYSSILVNQNNSEPIELLIGRPELKLIKKHLLRSMHPEFMRKLSQCRD